MPSRDKGQESVRDSSTYLHRHFCRVSFSSSSDLSRNCLWQSIPGTTADAALVPVAPFRSTWTARRAKGYATAGEERGVSGLHGGV